MSLKLMPDSASKRNKPLLDSMVNKKVIKNSKKPFKSKLLVNTVKEVVIHETTKNWSFTFFEDDSVVECWRCKLASKNEIKEKESLVKTTAEVLYTEILDLKGMRFSLDNKMEKIVTADKLIELSSQITTYLKWYGHWSEEVNFYMVDYEAKVKKDLDDQEAFYKKHYQTKKEREETPFTYNLGGDYSSYTNSYRKLTVGNYPDNNKAKNKIKKLFVKKYGKNHTLKFTAESDICIIETSNREEAVLFNIFIREEIIKPVLERIIGDTPLPVLSIPHRF